MRIVAPLVGLLGTVAPVLLPLVAIAGVLYAAWKTNFGGIQRVVETAWSTLQSIFIVVRRAIGSVIGAFREGGLGAAVEEAQRQFTNLGPKILKALQLLGRDVLVAVGCHVIFFNGVQQGCIS